MIGYSYMLPTVTDAEFKLIQQLIYKMAGVYIKEHKKTMVANRLRKRLENFGFSSYKIYYDFITGSAEGRHELIEFINCLTTNETFFFRHGEQLDFMIDKLIPQRFPELAAVDKIRIWSAACSSGEEPYSIAMLIQHKFKPELMNRFEIMASDINIEVIEKARKGIYKPYALQKMEPCFVKTCFHQNQDDLYAISDKIKKSVQFFRHNLLDYNANGKYDIVLCRNVMIYFDTDSKNRVLDQLYKCLKPGGFLITGYAESLFRTDTPFKYLQPTLYQKA